MVSGIEDGDERRIIDNLMTSLRSLVENTGVGMILISHLSVPQAKVLHLMKKVVGLLLTSFVVLVRLAVSDNIIGIERNQQGDDPDVSHVRLLKNRLFGDVGLVDTLRYHKDTGRLLVDDDCDEDNDDEFDVSSEFEQDEEEVSLDVPF